MANQSIRIVTKENEETRTLKTEIFIDGKKLTGVRSYTLKHEAGSISTLTLELNAFDLTVESPFVKMNEKNMGEIKEIIFE